MDGGFQGSLRVSLTRVSLARGVRVDFWRVVVSVLLMINPSHILRILQAAH